MVPSCLMQLYLLSYYLFCCCTALTIIQFFLIFIIYNNIHHYYYGLIGNLVPGTLNGRCGGITLVTPLLLHFYTLTTCRNDKETKANIINYIIWGEEACYRGARDHPAIRTGAPWAQ